MKLIIREHFCRATRQDVVSVSIEMDDGSREEFGSVRIQNNVESSKLIYSAIEKINLYQTLALETNV